MTPLVPENFHHQVGGSVDNFRLFTKSIHAIDETPKLDTADNAIKITFAGRLDL